MVYFNMMYSYLSMFNPIEASDVPRVHSRVIGRLYPARSLITVGEESVAISSWNKVTSPNGHRSIAIPEPGL